MPGKAGSKTFKYISFDISKDNDKITLDQTYHINNIKPIPISNQEKCNDSESAYYCQLVEKPNLVANQNRLDFSFNVRLPKFN